MERLLNGAGWRREEQRCQPPPSSPRIARTPALSRGSANATAPTAGHSSRHVASEMPIRTTNEKELLRGLNERFAGFIEKVRRLEGQNRALEEEIEDIRLKAKSATSLAKQYEPELQDLRRHVREMVTQKHQLELEQKRVQEECKALIGKCEEEARGRGEVEESISALKKYIDRGCLAKQEMDRKANALADEIEFLKRNHEAEVTDILTQMKETRVGALEARGFGKGELTAALRDIRTQLEGRALCNDTDSEQHFSKQLAKLTKAAEKDRETLIATKAEISQYKRQLQNKTTELDSFRGMREALERQLYDVEQRHTAEIHQYQDTIRELTQELKNTKYDMSSHVQEYHDLLNVKMALDAEIYSYRKLLEGEESRYSTVSDAQIPGRYVYRQSPIYTLPSVPRVGGVTRKAEPQYKFVEEIITETTREDIEILDTGSDDAEDQSESDKVCSEKLNEGIGAGREEHFEEKMPPEPTTEDYGNSLNAEQLDDKETTENKEQSIRTLTDVSTGLKEDLINTNLAKNNLTACEQRKEKDTDDKYNDFDNAVSKKALEILQADRSADENVENVAVDTEKEKQVVAKEIDQDRIKETKPTDPTVSHEAITEPGKSCQENIPLKLDNEKAKNDIQPVAEPEGSSSEKTLEKEREYSEVKSVEVDTSSADPQQVPQKAEAGFETHAKSEADSMPSVETAQADALNTTKAASAKEAQKLVLEKVKPEAQLKKDEDEIQPKEEKKMDSKPEDDTVSVKTEKVDSSQSTEEQKTQASAFKPAAKDPEVETSEGKKSQAKDLTDGEKTEGSIEVKETEQAVHQMQSIEQPTVSVMKTKLEEQDQKIAVDATEYVGDTKTKESLKTEENVTTESSKTQKDEIQKDKAPKATEKEKNNEQLAEKQVSKNHMTSTDITVTDRVKPEGHEPVNKAFKDVQPEQSLPKTSPEKEQSTDQTKKDQDVHEIKNTTGKSDKTGTKQDSTKMDTTKMKDPKPPEVSSEKEQDSSQKASLKRESDMEAVTDNGVNI